jgi:hypothetical protein
MDPTRRAKLLPARQRVLPTERVGELPLLLYVSKGTQAHGWHTLFVCLAAPF